MRSSFMDLVNGVIGPLDLHALITYWRRTSSSAARLHVEFAYRIVSEAKTDLVAVMDCARYLFHCDDFLHHVTYVTYVT